jgi:hypothetical protein
VTLDTESSDDVHILGSGVIGTVDQSRCLKTECDSQFGTDTTTSSSLLTHLVSSEIKNLIKLLGFDFDPLNHKHSDNL